MLDIKIVRENPDLVKNDLKKRFQQDKVKFVDDLLKKDEEWRKLTFENQKIVHDKNVVSKEIATLKKEGKDASAKIKKLQEASKRIDSNAKMLEQLQADISKILWSLPNIMHHSVPIGKDESENVELRKVGKPKKFDFEIKGHAELAENLGIADFTRSAKISGKGFYFLKGELALLNQALIRFATDFLIKRGYTYIEPPWMIRGFVSQGVTDLGTIKEMVYKAEEEDLNLIPTAEFPLVGMYSNEVIDEEELPVKLVGFSPCFRREIGSHGVDEKGLFRTHQFSKVEQVIFCKPEDSYKMYDEIVKNTEDFFKALEIPYRILELCSGDMGANKAKSCDIEAWMPKQEKYREVGSATNCTDYQARRLNIRFGKKGVPGNQAAHTLNNTLVATSRAMIAILENNQNKDGSITIPKKLVPYMNGIKKIALKSKAKAKDKKSDNKK
jgi:seryl-tRNA synthetase